MAAVVSFAGMLHQPESPRWLAGRDVARAGESLRHFRAGEDPEEELEGIVQAAKASSSSQTVSGKLAQVWEVRRAFFIGGGLLMLQQVSGQPAVLYFAPTIFQNAGLGAQSSKVASVLVGVVKLLSTVVASLKVDSFGRVPLLLCGVGLMFASLAALSLTTWLWTAQEGSRLVIFELMALVTAYQIGFGPISWLILTEVCPLRVRGNMVGLGVSVNFAFNVLAAQTLPVLTTALGMPGLFALYASVCLLSLAFIKAVVPETKGRTLEEIGTCWAWGPGTSRARRELASALWLVGSCVLHSVFVSLSSSQRAHLPSSCESLGAGYLACPRFNRMLTLCKGISRDRAAASENESWSGFVPNFIVYTNPKSTLRFRRRRCDVKKKKKTQARNVSPSRPSSKRVCYVCVCVLEGEGEGEGTRTYLRLGSPPGRSSSVSRCVVEGRRKTRVRGLVVLGSVTWFFFFLLFSATHTKNLATEDMVALCASLSL